MFNTALDIVRERIHEQLGDDREQIEVVFSPSPRILVEAPAGYGKTNTMISKIAFMFASKQVPNPKKMLALTFSVNAAYKIKKDVNRQLPFLLNGTGIDLNFSDKIFVSNYHGFCRSVLKKYGSKLHPSLRLIDTLQSVDDKSIKGIQQSARTLSYNDAKFIVDYNTAIKDCNGQLIRSNFHSYCDLVLNELLSQNLITYNSIITLTIKLFRDYPEVLKFYQSYYSSILIDEYQDTNLLSYGLIKLLVNDNTSLIVLGDSLQRIYGFIGAVPKLFDLSIEEFSLEKITLSKNYRFASNQQMLLLDSNIRKNAENPSNPSIVDEAEINLKICKDQSEEALEVASRIETILQIDAKSKIAVLVKQRGANINAIIHTFESQNISYFYGLFTDEDKDYVQFHRHCLFEFIELLKTNPQVNRKLSQAHLQRIDSYYKSTNDSLTQALADLLQIFWTKLFTDFSFLTNEEKIIIVKDTFEHTSLKQYIEFVPSNIIVSTVHAAKGLEWDYVLIPDMEEDSFPNYYGLCGACLCRSDCNLILTKDNEAKFLEELSIFYVAVTRAKKQVFFTASDKAAADFTATERVKKLSCFLKLKGIKVPIVIPSVSTQVSPHLSN